MDYYSLLGIKQNFTDYDELKKNYKRMVLKCHPDKFPKKRKLFEKVVKAYKTLSNCKQREQYNIQLKQKKIFLETYFDLLNMCLDNLKNNTNSLELFFTIDDALVFDDTFLNKQMKKLAFQIASCEHHNKILYTVKLLLKSKEIQNCENGMNILKKILSYVLTESRRERIKKIMYT